MRIKKKWMVGLVLTWLSGLAMGQAYDISIVVKGIADRQAIVGYHFGNQRLVLDTLAFDDRDRLRLTGNERLPNGVYFLYTPTFYFEFLVAEPVFSLETTVDGGYHALKVSGSEENARFKDFQLKMTEIQRGQRLLADSLRKLSGSDSIALRGQILQLSEQGIAYRDSLIDANEGTFFGRFVGLMRGITVPVYDEMEDGERRIAQYRYYKDHYFDLVPEPAELMRTPVVHEYVMKYFNELVVPYPDSVIREVDAWMAQVLDDKEAFRYWLVTLFNTYQESKIMGMDAVTVHMAERYYLSGLADWVTEDAKKEIQKEVAFIKPNLLGNPAPALNLLDTAMRPFPFQQLNQPYLVLYFYDPDCGVCKKKTPLLQEAYSEILAEGGEVVGICTITDVNKWKSYIRERGLDWVNLGDPYGRSNFRAEYNVRSTPQVYILDKNRKIIAKKIDVEQVVNFLRDHKSMK